MSETNPSSQRLPEESPGSGKPPETGPKEIKLRKRRRWPWVIGGVVLLILLLVLLAPTLLSVGPGKSFVLGIVNDNLDGKVEVADWSLGWNSGITVNGLKLLDDKGAVVLQASRVRTELSVWKALTSGFTKLALGRTDVDNLDLTNLHIDSQGTPNVVKVAKGKKKRAAKPASAPMEISGDFHINNMTGNVTSAASSEKLHINPSNVAVKLTGLNEPIQNDIQLAFTVEDSTRGSAASTAGSIALVGTADLFDGGKLRLDKANAKEQLKLKDVNLAGANPLLTIVKPKFLEIAGLANGTLDVNLQGTANAAATGQIVVNGFVAGGEALNGDQFKSNLDIPIKITRAMDNKGLVILKIDEMRINTDYGDISVTADASQESLQQLRAGKAPGREGHVTVMANLEHAAKLINSMPHTLKLIDGVTVNSATLFAQLEGWIYPDRVVSKAQLQLANVSGTNKGGKIALSPINSVVDATYAPDQAQAFTLREVQDVGISLDSAFAKFDGGTGKGGTLAKFTLNSTGDLAKLQKELGQFSDLGGLVLSGTWTLKADTDGDPSKPDAAIKTTLQLTANNLTVKNLGNYPPITQPWLNLLAKGDVHLLDNSPRSVSGAEVTLKSNNPDNPTIDLHATGDFDFKTFASQQFDVSVKALLAKARDEFAAVAPQLNYVEAGTLTATAAGSYAGGKLTLSKQTPLAVNMKGLALRQSTDAKSPVLLKDQAVDVTFAGVVNVSDAQISADAAALSVVAPKLVEIKKNDGALTLQLIKQPRQQITGNGGLTLYADAKRLMDLYKSFSPAAAKSPEGAAGQLVRGILNGSLTFSRGAQAVTTIAGDFVADVGLTTSGEPVNDKLTIALKALAPDDLTQTLSANVNVKSNMLNASVQDAVLVMAHQLSNQTTAFNGPIEMLRSARVSVTADRLDALQSLVESITPATPVTASIPAKSSKPVSGKERISAPPIDAVAGEDIQPTKPLPPLRITGGKLAFNSNVARENQMTVLKDTALNIAGLKFQRGEGAYAAQRPIDLKLAAAITSSGESGAISKLELRDLSGDLGAGQVKMLKPIVVVDVSSPSRSIDGAIELQGELADALRLLEAYQAAKPGSKYPYAGSYVLSQEISSKQDTTHLVGSLKASQFKVFDPANPAKVTFSEDLLTLANDVAANLKTNTATINNLAINMQSTGALALQLSNGQLIDWTTERKIGDKLKAHLKVDWPKFWTLVKPMLDPDTQKSFADLELAGVMERDFSVSGSFPAQGTNKRGQVIPLNTAQSLRSLYAYGGLNIERVAVSGLDVRNLELPVSLEKGILYIQDATKPKAQRYPQAFACNGGTIDLGGVQIDVRHTDATGAIVPWFTIPDANKVVMKNVAFNPLLAGSTLGNYVNPGFSGAQDARGRVTLTSVECRDVPLDWFTASKKENVARKDRRPTSTSDGRAEFLVGITEMQLKAPLLPFLLKTDQLSGEVRKGQIIVENGIVKSDIPVELANGNATLEWSGSVNLQDRRILNFNTAIPKELLADLPLLRNNEKLIPKVVNVPISGAFDAPKIDLVGAVTKSLVPGLDLKNPEDLLKNLPDLINGAKKKKDKGNTPRGDEPINRDPSAPRSSNADDGAPPKNGAKQKEDVVGDLLDIAGGLLDKNKKKNDRQEPNEMPADRNAGDERISSPPKAVPATAPATQRNVSGRTRGARDK